MHQKNRDANSGLQICHVGPMTGHRDALANPKPAKMLDNTLAFLGAYHQWTRCDETDSTRQP